MFQENQLFTTMDELIKNRFPNSVKEQDRYLSYTNSKEEFEALRNGVGIRVILNSTIIQLTGKDVRDFLNRISTNKITDLELLNARNTLFLNEKGKFIDRTTLMYLENEFMLVGSPDADKRLQSWINKYIIMEDISTTDVSDKYSVLEFIGRQVDSFLTMLIGDEINSVSANTIKRFYIDGFVFDIYSSEENNGIKVFKVLIEADRLANFLEHLFNNKSVFDVLLVGSKAYDAFRIKNKIPAFPNEINDSNNPYEVGLLKEVCFTKGCYIGQEVIARLETYDKVKRKMLIVSSEENIDFDKATVLESSNVSEAGVLTSLSNSELFEHQLGLALVNKKCLEQKDELFIQKNDRKVRLRIVE